MSIHAISAATLALLTFLSQPSVVANPVDCQGTNFNDDRSGLQCTIKASKQLVKWPTQTVYDTLFNSAEYKSASNDQCPDLGPQHGKRSVQLQVGLSASGTSADNLDVENHTLEPRKAKVETAFASHKWQPGYYTVTADVSAAVGSVKYITNAIGTANVVNATFAWVLPCGLAVDDARLTDCHCYGPPSHD